MKIRTRIAPSPTGDPHVGTAYIALFNYCFAQKNGGEFILRIEDTDRTRSTLESEQQILRALRWLGLSWQEGPDVQGPHGPYRQSERGDIYVAHTQMLLDKGEAFKCFCTEERLSELRKTQMKSGNGKLGYDGHCLGLSPEEIEQKQQAQLPFVVRLKVPREGKCVIKDLLRGDVEIEWSQVDMQVLLKSDNMPTYHLANVVDDHLMEISHVIRGEEWIISTPKHLRLYEAFGWTPPQFCHLPLLRNPDKSKLSKRKNPTSITYYERMGFLPEAMLNYLGRMAWSMPSDEEKFSLTEMISHFDLSRISLGGPIFDIEKLSWLNGRWMRENHDTQALIKRFMAWQFNEDYFKAILPMLQPRLEKLSDIGPFTGYFLGGAVEIDISLFDNKKVSHEQIKQSLVWAMWKFDELRSWQITGIEEILRNNAVALNIKLKDYLAPFFPALTGKKSATPLFETIFVLGKDLVRARLRNAIECLGGMSKTQEEEWKKLIQTQNQEEEEA
jgi:glutamyl-tRNA synthetase